MGHKRDVIIALDFAGAEEALTFLDKFQGRKPFVKVGMELYYAAGNDIIKAIKDRGHKIFLDLKLHDIPNTVKQAASVLAKLGVDMSNVHAAGTTLMMEAAMEGFTSGNGPAPLVIAVTQLTSTSEQRMCDELLIDAPMDEVVAKYALNAKTAGLHGVVCSPLEARVVRDTCGDKFITVTPGIRFAGGDMGDQVRVTTPAMAKEIGSHYIVVGRAVTAAPDPVAAYEQCITDFVG